MTGESDELDGTLQRFGLVFDALARRPLRFEVVDSGPACWDGRTVRLPRGLGDQALASALIHAAFAGQETFAVARAHRMWRSSHGARYLSLEGTRAVDRIRVALPGLAWLFEGLPGDALTLDAAESWERAGSDRSIVDPVPVFGQLRRRLDRSAVPDHGPSVDDDEGSGVAHEGSDDIEREEPLKAERRKRRDVENGTAKRMRFGGRRSPGRTGEDAGSSDSPGGPPNAQRTSTRAGDASAVRTQLAGTHRLAHRHEDGGLLLPEWDARISAYRPDWCAVSTAEVVVGAGTSHVPKLDRQLAAGLAALARSPGLTRGHLQGVDLDLDAIVRLRVDIEAGQAGDDRVYRDATRSRRQLALAIIVDASGSTKEPGPAGRTTIDHHIDLAGRLLVAADHVGIDTAAWGFSSLGREHVILQLVKDFGASSTTSTYLRLGNLRIGGYTRTGAAIRAAARSARKLTDTRVGLVVITDGVPFDRGYDLRHGAADTRRALEEARAAGVAVVALTFSTGSLRVDLDEVFGSSAFIASTSYSDMGPQIVPALRSALRKPLQMNSTKESL